MESRCQGERGRGCDGRVQRSHWGGSGTIVGGLIRGTKGRTRGWFSSEVSVSLEDFCIQSRRRGTNFNSL